MSAVEDPISCCLFISCGQPADSNLLGWGNDKFIDKLLVMSLWGPPPCWCEYIQSAGDWSLFHINFGLCVRQPTCTSCTRPSRPWRSYMYMYITLLISRLSKRPPPPCFLSFSSLLVLAQIFERKATVQHTLSVPLQCFHIGVFIVYISTATHTCMYISIWWHMMYHVVKLIEFFYW